MLGLRCLPRWLFILSTCMAASFLAVYIQSKYVREVTCQVDPAGDSLVAQVVVVTGASSGIGFQIALEMTRRGARVILGCLDPVRGQSARQRIVDKTGSKTVAVVGIDLSDIKKVSKFYDKILDDYGKVDILVNNAATGQISTSRQITSQGLERTLAVNHLGPMHLTKLILPILTDKGKVITITCAENLYSGVINPDDLNGAINYDPTTIYQKTKLLNIMMARHISKLLKPGQTSHTVDPGITWTNLYADLHGHMHLDTASRFSEGQHGVMGWVRYLAGPVLHNAACPSLAWQSAVWLATGGASDVTGHVINCKSADDGVNEQADNVELADAVWKASEQLIESAFIEL